MNVGFLSMQKYENRKPLSVGSSRIRGTDMMAYCPEITEFKNGGHYDAVIYQKAYWKDHMEQFKGIKIFDICDPLWMEGRPMTEVTELCDAITCSTDALTNYIKQLTDKPVITIPDRINPEQYYPTKEMHIGKARTAVWFGYSQNQVVLDQVITVLKKYDLKLIVISDKPYRDADVNIKWDVNTVNKEIIAHDVVIMPTYIKDKRFIYKSNNKTLTSWALKMPVVTEIPDLEKFMDPKERQKEAEQRYQEVMTKWHVRESGPQYLDLIGRIQKEKNG
jgi:hypothetical protein